jgi:hypothetical protein
LVVRGRTGSWKVVVGGKKRRGEEKEVLRVLSTIEYVSEDEI